MSDLDKIKSNCINLLMSPYIHKDGSEYSFVMMRIEKGLIRIFDGETLDELEEE